MQHDRSLQRALSPMHGRKTSMGYREVFFLPAVPISSFVLGQCIIRRFLCSPPFINLETRFLLRGRAVTPHIMASLITFIKALI
jgi:hypothetical protein